MKRAIMALLCVLLIIGTFPVQAQSVDSSGGVEAPPVSDYADKRIAVMTGSNFPELVAESFPNAEMVYLNTVADMLSALKSNKVDAVALDEPVARNMMAESGDVVIADGYLESFDFAVMFAKDQRGQALCDEVSEFIRQKKEDGSLEELQKKWFDNVPERSMMSYDPASLPETNGAIRVASSQYPPFTIWGADNLYGYDADLLTIFAKEKGYSIEFVNVNVDAAINAVQSGRADMAADGIAITEERKEMMLFSEPDYSGGVVLIVRNEGRGAQSSLFGKVMLSFEKTFIRENRYLLFVKGIMMTLKIVLLSTLFGTALGFLIFMACRKGNAAANSIASAFSWLINGMPVVVLLMILFYVVFGNVSISGAVVSIIGFTLIFGAEVYGMIKTAVGAVDIGQMEAAQALGYTDLKAFFRHILPQALPHFMPAYRGGLVSLIKSTSIVGYVAVEDLTKMGDIVRSRTFEAFFPLIVVAIIYFILAGVLVFIINRLTLQIDPTRRDKESILKGINVHDRIDTP